MALWTPEQLTGINLWLDADDASTLTLIGGKVAQWDDKSGNGRNAVQTDANLRPTYNATALGGKPAVVWPYAVNSNSLNAPTFSAKTWFFVTRVGTGVETTTAGEASGLFGARRPVGESSDAIGFRVLSNGTLFSWPTMYYLTRFDGGIEYDARDTTVLPMPNTIIQSTIPTAYTANETWPIGSDRNYANASWTGPIAEVLAFPEDLSNEDRQLVEGYLAHKWGTEAELPDAHPYKDAAPTTDTTVNVSIPNVPDGARYRIFNQTRSNEEIENALVSGGAGISTSFVADDGIGVHQVGDTIAIDIAYPVSTTAKLPSRITALAAEGGISALASIEDDTVYNFHGIDGSTLTKFGTDFVQDDIEITVGSNFVGAEIYAFYAHVLLSESGIREWLGAITAVDNANFRINTSILPLLFDNQTSTEVWQTDNVRVFRADGARPVRNPTTGGGGIDINWRSQVYLTVVTTSAGVITGDIDDIPARVQTGLTAQGFTTTRAERIDTLSTSTQLNSAQTSIESEIASLNNISASDVLTQASAALASYDAPTKAELDAAQSAIQTDIAGIETALTSSDIEAIATAVEAAILNETDGQAILEAIVNAIGNENIDQIALVAAIRSDLERVGGSLDSLPTLSEIESSTLAKEATIAALNNISLSDINSALASYDAATETDVNKAVVDVLLAQRDMKDNLDILNTGVKKSSLLIPHVNNLEEVEYTPLSPQDSDAFVTSRGLIFNASEE